MLINWFTVGAQLINFVILVWLLKRFLYKPVLNAIDAREKRVAATLTDADKKMKQVNAARDDLQARLKDFYLERGTLLSTAIRDSKAEGQRLLGTARQAADALTAQRDAELHDETARLSGELSRLAAFESINIARAVLKDLAGADLETRISQFFIRRLRGMDSQTKESFRILLTGPDDKPVVASSFDLSPTDKSAIQTALNETFSADIHLRFEASSNALAGIELSASGQRLSWTIADYLTALEERVAKLLSSAGVAAGVPATGPPASSTALAAA